MGPERRIPILVAGGVAAILLAAAADWFLSHFERRTVTIPIGQSAEARRDPLLALGRLLARLGVPVQGMPGRDLLWKPPAPRDTLVVQGLGPLSETRRARLISWLKAGGTLVTEAENLGGGKRLRRDLLADFGIRLCQVEDDEKRPGRVEAQVALPGLPETAVVAFAPGRYLGRPSPQGRPRGAGASGQDCPNWSAGPSEIWPETFSASAADRTRLVSLPVGRGRISVLSDTDMLTNGQIGDNDHALLAAYLSRPAPGGKVWLLYDSAVPWLGALLWSAAPMAILSATVALGVWLWSLSGRLGPLEPPPDRRRRNLLEHLDASASYLWRHAQASRLVEATRRRCLADWERHRPELRRLSPQARARAIASASGQTPGHVSSALIDRADGPAAFVAQAAALQALWRGARPGHRAARPHTQIPEETEDQT